MKARTTLVLCVLAVIVLAAGWFSAARFTLREHRAVAAGTLVFPGLTDRLQNVAKIEIVGAKETLTLAQQGGKWELPDRAGYPANQGKVRTLLTDLTELRRSEPKTSNPAEYARLGLEDPTAPNAASHLVRVLDAKGASLAELVVGHARPRTTADLPDTVYIRLPGQADVAGRRVGGHRDRRRLVDRRQDRRHAPRPYRLGGLHPRRSAAGVQAGRRHLAARRPGRAPRA
jgi:hypothetical protein